MISPEVLTFPSWQQDWQDEKCGTNLDCYLFIQNWRGHAVQLDNSISKELGPLLNKCTWPINLKR